MRSFLAVSRALLDNDCFDVTAPFRHSVMALYLTLGFEGFQMLRDGLIEKSLFWFPTLVCELASAHFAKEAL
jgi:hypothetical protein